MKRVLEVVYGFGYGGIRSFIMNYLHFLDKEKYSVDIYVFGFETSPFKEQVEALGAHIFFEPENNGSRNILKFVKQLRFFMLKNGPYDVVHAHNNLISAWVLVAAKFAGVPVRLSHSHSSSHFTSSCVQNIYSYLRRFVIDLFATHKLACGKKAGIAMYGRNSDFIVISNGIDVDAYSIFNKLTSEQFKRKLSIPDGAKIYANISRLDNNKNHLFVIKVFEDIAKNDINSYLIVGGGSALIDSSENEVRNAIGSSKYKDRIRLLGPQMDMPMVYGSTDCWIYPSIHEGLPIGPIELQAASIPVLLSDSITKEVDLGLGLVQFASLKESPKVWAEIAMRMKKSTIPYEKIKEAFREHNLDVVYSVKTLEKIYDS